MTSATAQGLPGSRATSSCLANSRGLGPCASATGLQERGAAKPRRQTTLAPAVVVGSTPGWSQPCSPRRTQRQGPEPPSPAKRSPCAGDQQDHSPWSHAGPCSQRGPGFLFQGERRCPDKQGLSPVGGCPVGVLRPPGRRCQCPALALKPVPRRAPTFSAALPALFSGRGLEATSGSLLPVGGVQSGQGGTR